MAATSIKGLAVGHMDGLPPTKRERRARSDYGVYGTCGPRCYRCQTVEAHCARDGHACCADCTHSFGVDKPLGRPRRKTA